MKISCPSCLKRLFRLQFWLPRWHSGKESTCRCRRQETWVWSLGWEDPLEKEMATYSNILAWKIPWTEEHGGLQSIGSQEVRHNWACTQTSVSMILKLKSLEVILGPFAPALKLQNSIKFRTINTSIFRSIPKNSFSQTACRWGMKKKQCPPKENPYFLNSHGYEVLI